MIESGLYNNEKPLLGEGERAEIINNAKINEKITSKITHKGKGTAQINRIKIQTIRGLEELNDDKHIVTINKILDPEDAEKNYNLIIASIHIRN